MISEAQLVREYYVNVGKALLRSYAMVQLAYMLKSLAQHRNFHTDATNQRVMYLERYAEIQNTIEHMLNAASRDLWKCNPNPYFDSRKHLSLDFVDFDLIKFDQNNAICKYLNELSAPGRGSNKLLWYSTQFSIFFFCFPSFIFAPLAR